MKLTAIQVKVLTLLRECWELGRDPGTFVAPHWWLQKNGLGKGGEVYYPRFYRTCIKLEDLGLIERVSPGVNEFPTEHWRLTELGRNILVP